MNDRPAAPAGSTQPPSGPPQPPAGPLPPPSAADNPILLQGFAWDLPADSSHWRLLTDNADLLASAGVSAIWLPPAYKGQAGAADVGYGVYDLYDLGEFDQKGTIATKYGTRDEYLAAVRALHEAGMTVLADIVLNHRMGADALEEVMAVEVDPADRTRRLSGPTTVKAWTRFIFPGRGGAYSEATWDWRCFTGADWDDIEGRAGVWLFEGKEWDDQVTAEHGNFDYLMGVDVDLADPRVIAELTRWGRWFLETTGVDGVRLDALKHMSWDFYRSWLPEMRRSTGTALPAVGEYWSGDVAELRAYLGPDPVMSLFDTPLHFQLHRASCSGGEVDLSRLFEGTLVEQDPAHAVTFVDNHDTQPGQSLQSAVAPWFKPAAYALILLRAQGTPCVFWGDLFGTPETGDIPAVTDLPMLMQARRRLAHGPQHDAFAAPDLIAFAREGDQDHPASGVAVVVSDRRAATCRVEVGVRHAGGTWVSVIGGHGAVVVEEDGTLELPVSDGGLSVYVPQAAEPLLARDLHLLTTVR